MESNKKYVPYTSGCGGSCCRCFRNSKIHSKVMGEHKKKAHRMFRRVSKKMLQNMDDSVLVIGTGYTD